MAKQIVHVGLAVSTDGFLPGRSNIINLAANIGSIGDFNVNIAPQGGNYGDSPFWTKHPVEFEALKVNPLALPDAMAAFRSWLKQWQGNLVACTSSLDFWHLFEAMLATGKDCPFGSAPMDTNSYGAALEGKKSPRRLQSAVVPLEVAKERWTIVTEGKLPLFGTKPKVAAPKVVRRRSLDEVSFREMAVPTPPANLRTWTVSPVPDPRPGESSLQYSMRIQAEQIRQQDAGQANTHQWSELVGTGTQTNQSLFSNSPITEASNVDEELAESINRLDSTPRERR